MDSKNIVSDLQKLGFEWKVTKSFMFSSVLEITYQGETFQVSNKKRHPIWSVIRTKMRDLGYSESDVKSIRQIMTSYG